MKYFYGHPDDPANPQGGIDIDNDQLEDMEQNEAENKNKSDKED